MKKRYKVFITFLILLMISLFGFWSWKTGVVGDYLSQLEIPFQTFYKENTVSVQSLQVESKPTLTKIEDLNKLVGDLNEKQKNKNHLIKDEILNLSTVNIVEKKLNSILKQDNTWIYSVTNSGIYQDKNGWSSVLTFNIVDESTTIQNISFAYQIKENKINFIKEVSSTKNNWEYENIPVDFDINIITKNIENESKTIKEKLPLKLQKYSNNTVLESVYFDYNNLSIIKTWTTGTNKDIERTLITTKID